MSNQILPVIWLLQVSGEEHIYFRPIIWAIDEYSISCNICISDTICLGGFPNALETRLVSRFSRDASRFVRESLKHLVWNILYMYYSQEASVHIKDGAAILTCKHQQKVRSNVHCEILGVSIDCSIHVEQTY